MATKLRVRDLKISFRTVSGKLQAVRGIDFELSEGETLAIVGESGSGKSVTSKAILGILAGNAEVEGGEIIYEGRDLLKLSEEEFYKLRGDKLAMIFQDPLSSLNPIMKIGNQLTEAMLLKSKARARECRKSFNSTLRRLERLMIEAVAENNEEAARISAACRSFYSFAFKRAELDDGFMIDFKKNAAAALELSANRSYEGGREALKLCESAYKAVMDKGVGYGEFIKIAKPLVRCVRASADPMEKEMDGAPASFESALRASLASRTLERGKIARIIAELKEHYEVKISTRPTRNYALEAERLIDYLGECAAGVLGRITRSTAKMRALKLMEEVGIPEPSVRYGQYPFEFSGGMRQRIVIAIALAANPDVLICDEPTTALDVTIQAQILELIGRLKRERNLSIIFITHDLGVVANVADRIAVMYAGKIVEYGTASDIFYSPAHPYTWALLSSMPDLDTKEKLEAIPGTPPNMIYPPVGDAFAERNRYAMKIDFEESPPMFKISDTHFAATWLLHPDAPKIKPPRVVTERIERMKKLRGEAEND